MSEKRLEEMKRSVHHRILQQPEPTAAFLTYFRVTWSSANYKLYQEMVMLNLLWKLKRACVCPESKLRAGEGGGLDSWNLCLTSYFQKLQKHK